MPKKTKADISRAEYLRLSKDVERNQRMIAHQTEQIEGLRKDCETNLRRCGELQAELDALRKSIAHRRS